MWVKYQRPLMDVGPTQRRTEVGVIMGFRKLKLCLKTACKLLLHGRGAVQN